MNTASKARTTGLNSAPAGLAANDSIHKIRAKQPGPKLYETDADRYVGPQRWQTQWWARLARRAWRHRAYTRWVRQACTELTVRGSSHLQAVDTPCIFIANHQSHLDTLVVYESLPERIRRRLFFGAAQDRWFLKGQKKTVLKPWYQSLVLGNFPVMRGGGADALSYATELLQQGEHVFLFPEGTRATGESLGEFRHGVALLATRLGVPVVPIYLSGLKALQPKGSREVVPGPVAIEFLEPQCFTAETSVPAATAMLHSAMNAAHRCANANTPSLPKTGADGSVSVDPDVPQAA